MIYLLIISNPNKKRKYEQVTTKWLATSNIKLGEDAYKIQEAGYKTVVFNIRGVNLQDKVKKEKEIKKRKAALIFNDAKVG